MSLENPKILIVDDEADIAASFQSFLGKRGFLVNTTASGKDALDMIKVSKPDLVFLDLALHELNGREVLKKLREHDKKTKVVIITGHTFHSEKEKKKFLSSGADAYLNKPVSLEDLEKIVHSLLGGHAQPRIVKTNNLAERSDKTSASIVHSLSNLLGIIRNKCENFTLSMEENIYKDKTDKELLEMSVGIMGDVINTVDKAMDVVDKIKSDE